MNAAVDFVVSATGASVEMARRHLERARGDKDAAIVHIYKALRTAAPAPSLGARARVSAVCARCYV
jgi:hypothetical protein